MKKVLILGINGFTGRHFQEYIIKKRLREDFVFFGADLSGRPGQAVKKYMRVDLRERKNTKSMLLKLKPDYIINLAASSRSADFNEMRDVNAGISRNLLDLLVKHSLPVRNLLLIGSAAEYGRQRRLPVKEDAGLHPVNDYGLSKLLQTVLAEFYCRSYGLNVNIARTFNLIGRGMPSSLCAGYFAQKIRDSGDNAVIRTGNLRSRRDFLAVEDAVDAYWKILLLGKRGETYNVCSGRSYLIKEILDGLIKASGKRITAVVDKKKLRGDDITDIRGDNRKLSRDTGWKQKKDIFNVLAEMVK